MFSKKVSTKVNELTRFTNDANLKFGYMQENINVVNKLTETNIKNIEVLVNSFIYNNVFTKKFIFMKLFITRKQVHR